MQCWSNENGFRTSCAACAGNSHANTHAACVGRGRRVGQSMSYAAASERTAHEVYIMPRQMNLRTAHVRHFRTATWTRCSVMDAQRTVPAMLAINVQEHTKGRRT